MMRKIPTLIGVTLLLFIMALLAMRGGAETTKAAVKSREADIKAYQLLAVGPGKPDQEIVVNVNDMVRITPFTYPVTPKFLDAKLDVQLEGDRSIELIGQSSGVSTDKEGRSGMSAFFLARESGQVTVKLALVGAKNQAIEGYAGTTYVVRVR